MEDTDWTPADFVPPTEEASDFFTKRMPDSIVVHTYRVLNTPNPVTRLLSNLSIFARGQAPEQTGWNTRLGAVALTRGGLTPPS